MDKQTHPVSCSLPPPNQDSDKPSMACQQVGAGEPTGRSSSGGADDAGVRTHIGAEDRHVVPLAPPADDFEFCVLSSGRLAPLGDDAAADMCVADEVFSGGKLLPLRLSSAASADASPAALLLLRSDSLDAAATSTTSSSGFSSRSVSRSSSSVSRSTSSNSASSDHAGPVSSSSSIKTASSADAAVSLPPRRSLSGSVFYAHPSPSPRPPPRRSRSRTATTPAAARRMSTGSAPPASWGVIRLGVVGAPEVYAPRAAEYRKVSASRSARFEQHRAADKKLALGLLGAGLVCSCSPDAVAPVGSAEVAAAEARRRRKKAEEKKRSAPAPVKQSGKGTARRSRILEWLEDLAISKEKSAASSCR